MNSGTFTYESGPLEYEDFPYTNDTVYILGKAYNAFHERDDLKHDIRSRIWVTYRRNFHNIGGLKGPNSDTGWGCMLRCGQMMMAQALILHHLGRDWRWYPGCEDDKYWRILRMFEDRKMATYSIHQIASMGEAEGKAVGQWFGPNTIAQVLKRIAVYDEWSQMIIHVSLDNIVIIEDILKQCKSRKTKEETEEEKSNTDTHSPSRRENGDNLTCEKLLPKGEKFSAFVNDEPMLKPLGSGVRNRPCVLSTNSDNSAGAHKTATADGHEPVKKQVPEFDSEKLNHAKGSVSPRASPGKSQSSSSDERWKPLVLIIPLRLGLTDINPIYYEPLQKCFSMKQSIGIIGGKPNHAHWFIGYVGKELIYLDPHTTQPLVDLDSRRVDSDLSYHCDTPPSRMSFSKLDPSIALGFYCRSEVELRELCSQFSSLFCEGTSRLMFEVRETAPEAWPAQGCEGLKVSVSTTELTGRTRGISLSDFVALDGIIGGGAAGSSVDDEEFELL